MSDVYSKWESKCCGIYAIFSKTTNKRYVGQTADKKGFSGRWMDHRASLRSNRHANIYLQRSYNKRGEKDFYFVILEVLKENNKELASSRENHWTEELKSMCFQNGWNIDTYDEHEKRTSIHRPKPRNLIKYEFISPTGEIVKGENIEKFARSVGGAPTHFNSLHHGRLHSYLGYKSTNPEFHRKYKTHRLVSPSGEIKEFNNICEFSRQSNLYPGYIDYVLLGKMAHIKGWHLENPPTKYLEAIKNYQFKYVESPDGTIYKFRSMRKFYLKFRLSPYLTRKLISEKFLNGWKMIDFNNAAIEI